MTKDEEFEQLRNIIIKTKYDLLQYKKAFLGDNKREKIYIMNETSPNFFESLAEYYWERMILGISRITDPLQKGKNRNLSVSSVVSLAESKNLKCTKEIKENYEECLKHVQNIRKYRSKIYAHLDMEVLESESMKVTISEVEKSFSIIENILNLYHLEVEETTWSFDLIAHQDIESLFYYLEQALIYEQMKEERKDWKQDNEEEQIWRRKINPT